MVERKTLNLVVEGSIPSEGVFYFFVNRFMFLEKTKLKSKSGRLAQLVEHWSNKPRVAGSSPVVTIFLFLSCLRTKIKFSNGIKKHLLWGSNPRPLA